MENKGCIIWMGIAGSVGLLVAVVVAWWVTTAAAEGRIGNNGVVGIRTQATMASERAWRAGHRAAVPEVRVVALVSGLFSLALLLAGMFAASEEPTLLVAVLFAAGYAVLLAGAVWAARTANQAARCLG